MYEEEYIELHNKIKNVMQDYADIYENVKNQGDWRNPFKNIIISEIPDLLRKCSGIVEPYIFEGSSGKGRWTAVPWISIFDTRITDTAQKGVYIVYLFNKDEKTMYLTLNQGATGVIQGVESKHLSKTTFTGVAKSSSKKNLQILKKGTAEIRARLDCRQFDIDDAINTGSENYDAGAICYKKYTVEDLPSGKEIVDDLLEMMKIYAQYYNNVTKKEERSYLLTWNPANYEFSEYENRRQDVLNGIEYIDQWACTNTHVEIGDRVYLMRIGAGDKNGIVASGHAVRTSYSAPHYDPERAAAGEEIKKIDVEFDCLLDRNGPVFLKQSELNDLFPNQQWSPQGSGIEIKEEYRESLEEEWQKYMNNEQGEEEEVMEISVKEAIAKIKNYIASKGFTYSDGLIENFYLSLKSKPFVILAGTSGTGKTRLVRLFAQAIDAEYKMVPVRPDWSDSSDLFGHVDLNGNYIPGVILEFIADAYKHPNKPYILCLDEMNLARVEYYLSDFLSVIETRDFVGEDIVSDPLVSLEKYGSDSEARNKYGEIGFPPNLYLVGTVNMDETTFPFSKKVLDRANTIEFNYVDLIPDDNEYPETEKLSVPNSFLKTKYLLLAQCNEDKDYIKKLSEELQKLNLILQKANAHVGYRVRDEIAFYMLNNKETELISEDDAFDNEIMQKILPRIQGSSTAVKEMLCELFKEFAGDYTGIQVSSNDTASDMLKKIEKDGARYRKSAEKIAFMVRRFEEDGFTSYWL